MEQVDTRTVLRLHRDVRRDARRDGEIFATTSVASATAAPLRERRSERSDRRGFTRHSGDSTCCGISRERVAGVKEVAVRARRVSM